MLVRLLSGDGWFARQFGGYHGEEKFLQILALREWELAQVNRHPIAAHHANDRTPPHQRPHSLR
jgi:hypothetical protein